MHENKSLPKISVKKIVDDFLLLKGYQKETTLCAIMNSFGSDKGSTRHNYTTLYHKLFLPWKNEQLNIFELGVGTNNTSIPSNMGKDGIPGASLYGWELFFPNAQVFGADIDKNILFQNDRIKTFYCDQCDPSSIENLYNKIGSCMFDIIIEDGLHTAEASLTFLENSLHKLRKGGIYIAEDLTSSMRLEIINEIPRIKKEFSLSYIEVISIPYQFNHFDNCLLIIQQT